ncbi:MAG: hypothetical protein NC124_05440 [Clostridium sp.]|nr:hypothetical protein [Clostridium sp.]MCM1550051.1 hypothetical protein [Clostridium sp.]
MTEQITEKEVVRNMRHLVKLLHKEWEQSGRTKAEVSMNPADARTVKLRLGEIIQKRQGQLEMEEITFQQSMEMSKENFILLRLVKKIKKAAEKAENREMETAVVVELDKEEYKLFSMLVKAEEE